MKETQVHKKLESHLVAGIRFFLLCYKMGLERSIVKAKVLFFVVIIIKIFIYKSLYHSLGHFDRCIYF
jgi:hypothetical protein